MSAEHLSCGDLEGEHRSLSPQALRSQDVEGHRRELVTAAQPSFNPRKKKWRDLLLGNPLCGGGEDVRGNKYLFPGSLLLTKRAQLFTGALV